MSYIDQITIGSSSYDIQDSTVPAWARSSSAPVESVNGATGIVVLDADDVNAISKWDLLWTNASPTSPFAAQNISVDLSEYDFAAIYVKYSYNQDNYNPLYFIPLINQTHYLFYTAHSGSANAVGARSCRYSPTDKTMIFGSNWHSGSTNNDYFIPVKIYGIKGVITT